MRLRIIVTLGCVATVAAIGGEAAPASPFEREIKPLLANYCFKCHGPEKPKAGVNLTKFTNEQSVNRDPKLWQTALRMLRQKDMPPEGKPQPTADERDRLVRWVETAMNSMDFSKLPKDPGRVTIRRMNRTEYNNTVRDLFGVSCKPADKFPADGGGGGGFDNNADTLYIPPLLMEKLLAAADEVLAQAFKPGQIGNLPYSKSRDRKAALKIIEHFVPRVFRRPAEPGEIERLMGLFDQTRKQDAKFEDAVKTVLKAMLVSPNFLYRIETDRETAEPYPISDYELASRLSYWVWASMPDDELFKVAEKKKLRDPKILDEQVRRMVRDPKSRALADNFAAQWLGIENLKTTVQPDPRRFPMFTPPLRDAMYNEALSFFDALVRENGSLLELLDSDYTFANDELARHYGISGVEGAEMRRVTLSDRNRGGLLGMGAILALTSYPQRTSPVLRGRWVLEEILGTPPPPPPPMVAVLPPDDKARDGLTFRQRLEQHRSKPQCAACHARMDPIGFALENFDAVGRWRTEVGGKPVDTSGVLTSGEKVNGPRELKAALLNKKDEFIRNLTEKMLAYALGRGVEYYDVPTVRAITAALAKDGYRSATLIAEIAKSYPFQYRRNQPIEAAQR